MIKKGKTNVYVFFLRKQRTKTCMHTAVCCIVHMCEKHINMFYIIRFMYVFLSRIRTYSSCIINSVRSIFRAILSTNLQKKTHFEKCCILLVFFCGTKHLELVQTSGSYFFTHFV